jgi:predicted DNA-binding mobile mystery protein A
MTNTKDKLIRMQITDALMSYPTPESAVAPRSGWIRSIREALGMSQTQLAARASVSRQSVQDFEKAEAERRITLESLDRMARAMGCRVVYALVPEKGSIDDLRASRAKALAETLMHPMLEQESFPYNIELIASATDGFWPAAPTRPILHSCRWCLNDNIRQFGGRRLTRLVSSACCRPFLAHC